MLGARVFIALESGRAMTITSIFRFALAIVLAGALGSAAAQETSQGQPGRAEALKGVLRLLPADAVTEHSIDTAKGKLAYTATAGTLAFYDQSGERSASVFYTAYVAKGAGANRPLTFVFNGGPGAASAFLHLGLVGPRILEIGRDAAHRIARETIESIAREQGHAVAEALQRRDLEGFHHVKDTWSGAGGDLQVTTLREDAEALDFNVTGCRFAEMYRRMGAEDLGFILSCSRDFALSEGYSDGLHLERRQTIMQGAPFCDFRYRLADAHRNVPAAEPAAETPAAPPADPSAAPDAPPAGDTRGDGERMEDRAAQIGGAQ